MGYTKISASKITRYTVSSTQIVPRGHQLPKTGVRISKSLEFTLISRDFMGFYQQKPDHHLIIMRLYINKITNAYLYCIL